MVRLGKSTRGHWAIDDEVWVSGEPRLDPAMWEKTAGMDEIEGENGEREESGEGS